VSSFGGASSAGRGGGTSMGGSTVSAGGASSGGASSGGAKASGGASSGGTSNGGASSGGASSGGTAGMTSADQCPRLDPNQPLQMLALSGNLGTHDPTLIAANDQFYLFHTGSRLPTKTSNDLKVWQAGAPVFSANPSWIAQSVPGATDLWAPDISFFGGVYHLYYSASTFGSNRSCIGHATRSSLSSGNWTDHGSLICSNAGSAKDDWNAIDPNVVVDESATPWLVFGSFWGGIKLLKLNTNGERADTQLLAVAARPAAKGALEAPVIVKACGYYYLFVSWDACCASPFDYNIRFGRSTKLSGPYLDKAGKSMLEGGGSLLVAGTSSRKAPGHNAVLFAAGKAYNVYHARDANNANPGLRIAELAWDEQSWPVSAGP